MFGDNLEENAIENKILVYEQTPSLSSSQWVWLWVNFKFDQQDSGLSVKFTVSSLIVLFGVCDVFEDLFEAINIQAEKCGEKEDPKPPITSLNKTNTCDGYDFNIDIINDD
jgi:hypothetical protein